MTYPHPSLESTLKRTLGVPLFQEQLLRMAMVVANFSGSEAEELRRAVGMRRSWERMKNLEGRLRAGMTSNGLDAATQETIIQNISSFALYGFPESHAASFALIAYASAYIKVKYLAAFTCAILNNQPMGFYSPSVLIEDARRHGLRVKPIDIQVSDWPCTVEHEGDQSLSLRLGLGYLRAADLASRPDGAWVKTAGLAFVKQRPGTASGVVFIGVADETGDFRIFVAPDFFEQHRRVIQQAKFIGVEGPIQKEGPIIHVMARSIYELSVENPAGRLKVESHDFH